MKRCVQVVLVALCAFGARFLGAVDLAGQNLTVTTLAAEGYSNSGGAATLTVDLAADTAYSGVVSGPITVVKKGAGKLTLSSKWTQTGGTTIESGAISVPDESYLCAESATVTLAGGCVALTTGTGWSLRKLLVPEMKTGTVDIAPGLTVMVTQRGLVTFTRSTLRITGGGIFYATSMPDLTQISLGTIEVADGILQFGDQVFGTCAKRPFNFTIRVGEKGALRVDNSRYLTLPRYTVMKGGTISARSQTDAYGTSLTHPANSYESVTLAGTLTVEPSATPTRILNYSTALAPIDAETAFDVQEGATLEIGCRMTAGMATEGSSANARAGQGFTKLGKGTLVLSGPVDGDGAIYVADGTLKLSNAAYLSCKSRLVCEPNAKIVLTETTTLAATVAPAEPQDAFLSQNAQVWMDASRLPYRDGQNVYAVPNLGTCGGTFGQMNVRAQSYGTYTANAQPLGPTFAKNGIGGHPSLRFDATQGLTLNSYTNKGDQIEVYCVYQVSNPTKDLGSSPAPFSICCASGNCPAGAFEDLGVAGTANGHVIIRPNGTWLMMIADHGAQRYTVDISSKGVATTVPFVLEHWRDTTGYVQGRLFYGPNASDYGQNGSSGHTILQDNEVICLGGRLRTDGAWTYNSRGFPGDIGEFIVFSRKLTDAERAYVETYLRRKWLGSTAELPALAGYTTPVAAKVPVTVTSGKAAFASDSAGGTVSGALEKDGAGTLVYASADPDLASVAVKAGGLELAAANGGSAAAVWIDASDAATLTLDSSDGTTRVKEIRNKGSAGGAFAQNPHPYASNPPYKAPCPPYASGANGINGLGVIAFDRQSALSTEAYVNRGREACGLYVYGVFERTEWANDSSKGNGAGPFSMTEKGSSAWDVSSDNALCWHETGAALKRIYWRNAKTKSDVTYENMADTGVPYLISCQFGSAYLVSEMVKSGDAMAYSAGSRLSIPDDPALYAPFSLDIIGLGGRLAANGSAALGADGMNRMWKGKLGEFLVFDRRLSQADEKELIEYLSKKWFGVGSGSATPPAFLTGRAAAPSVKSGTALTLADGVTLGSSAGKALQVGALTSEGTVTVTAKRTKGSTWMPLIGFDSFTGSLTNWLGEDGRSDLEIRDDVIGLAGRGFLLFFR